MCTTSKTSNPMNARVVSGPTKINPSLPKACCWSKLILDHGLKNNSYTITKDNDSKNIVN